MNPSDEFIVLRVVVQEQPVKSFCKEFGMDEGDVVASINRYMKRVGYNGDFP